MHAVPAHADDRVVITCAITGGGSRSDGNPNLPYTPEELAREARRAVDAGAGIIHVHGRAPDGTPTHDVEHFRALVDAIRSEVPEVALNLSCGGSAGLAERIRPVEVLRPELATLSLGCYNYAAFAEGRRSLKTDRAIDSTFATMVESLRVFAASGTAADLECYEIGHLDNLDVLAELGADASHGHLSFVLGVLGCQAADPRYLTYLQNRLGTGRDWTAIVIDAKQHWPVLSVALGMGGWVRVGFEDCAWLAPDVMATSNGQLVERAVTMARACGREVMPAKEARELVRVPVPIDAA